MPVSANHSSGQPITAADINALAALANANETAIAGVSGGASSAAALPFTPSGPITATDTQSAVVQVSSQAVPLTQKGAASGVASLDSTGKVPSAQLRAVPAQRIVLNPSGDTTGATDQAAVAAALTSLLGNTSRGGTLELGAGDWYWNSQQIDIYTNPARLKIVGQGQATRIHSTATGTAGTATALFHVYGGGDVAAFPSGTNTGAVGINWIDISGLKLFGSATSCGISYKGVYQGRIANVVGSGFTAASQYGTGFCLDYVIDITVDNCVGDTSYYGLYVQGNANNIYGGWYLLNTKAGVQIGLQAQGDTLWGAVCQGNTGDGLAINGSAQIRAIGCWFENNTVGVNITGLTNARSTATVIQNPVFSSNSTDVLVGSIVDNTTLVSPGAVSAFGTSLVVAAGSTNTTVVDPASTFTYANVQDGTAGAQFSIRRGRPVVNTVAASGATQAIPHPLVADSNRITLTANCTFTFPTPAKARVIELALTQDATGSRTVTWPVQVIWPSGTAPTLTTTPGRTDRFRFVSDDGLYWSGVAAATNYNPVAASGPLSVTGLLSWFDATQITGKDNTALTSWPDLSGNGRDLLQETASAKPTFYRTTSAKLINSQPAVWFNGAHTMVGSIVGSTSQPVTIYIVAYPTSLAGNPYFVDGSPRLAVMNGSSTFLSAYAGSEIDSAAGAATINTLHVLTAVFNGASSVLRDNGAQIAAGNTGANGFSQLQVGSRTGGNANFLTGAICEILVYAGAHSGATLTTIESYLSSKW